MLTSPDRIILQVEGGDLIKKSSAYLEDVGITRDCHLIATVSDKPPRNAEQSAAAKERRALKDEPKVPIIYTLRNPEEAQIEAKEEPHVEEGAEMMINTSEKQE